MKTYGVNELRKMFLDFFESKGFLCKSSYSLVPHNDNSVLLVPAGMAPLKPYFKKVTMLLLLQGETAKMFLATRFLIFVLNALILKVCETPSPDSILML